MRGRDGYGNGTGTLESAAGIEKSRNVLEPAGLVAVNRAVLSFGSLYDRISDVCPGASASCI